jgi:hypothetical protein
MCLEWYEKNIDKLLKFMFCVDHKDRREIYSDEIQTKLVSIGEYDYWGVAYEHEDGLNLDDEYIKWHQGSEMKRLLKSQIIEFNDNMIEMKWNLVYWVYLGDYNVEEYAMFTYMEYLDHKELLPRRDRMKKIRDKDCNIKFLFI